MTESKDESMSRSDFWMKAASVGFGLWALALPIGINMMRTSAEKMVESQSFLQTRIDAYILSTERRMVLIEERQGRSLDIMKDFDSRIDQLEVDLWKHPPRKRNAPEVARAGPR